MKNTLLLLFVILTNVVSSAQDSKATPPYEATQYVQNIIQELNIPDETFDKMRGKENIIQVKLFINDKGEVTDVTVSYDEDYAKQHLRYSKQYSALPNIN